MEKKSDEEISAIAIRLVEVGQTKVGLQFLDRTWRFGQRKGEEQTLRHALLAAQTRLQLGRYQEVDEPLTLAELTAKAPEERLAVLLVRMKLALRRNAYEALWKTYADIEALAPGDVHAQAEAQSTLNVAYRDLLNYTIWRAPKCIGTANFTPAPWLTTAVLQKSRGAWRTGIRYCGHF